MAANGDRHRSIGDEDPSRSVPGAVNLIPTE